MSTSVRQPGEPAKLLLIAPIWHTASLFVLMFTVLAALFHLQTAPQARNTDSYVLTIGAEWALFGFVWLGTKTQDSLDLPKLIGGRWSSTRAVFTDLGIAICFWILWTAVATGLSILAGPTEADSLKFLHPSGALEIALWVVMALSAGFCEEVIFRGYFQQQFTALTGSVAVGLVGQAFVFGVGHWYQGIRKVTVIIILGLLFGLLAHYRKSLRPGIISHCWSDVLNVIPIRIF